MSEARGKRSSIDDAPLRSSSNDFNRFAQSIVWYDMQMLIKDRIELLSASLVDANSLEQIKHLQGQIVAWKEMLGLPGYLKACADGEKGPEKQYELELN